MGCHVPGGEGLDRCPISKEQLWRGSDAAPTKKSTHGFTTFERKPLSVINTALSTDQYKKIYTHTHAHTYTQLYTKLPSKDLLSIEMFLRSEVKILVTVDSFSLGGGKGGAWQVWFGEFYGCISKIKARGQDNS